jgi:hypothetical protein
MEVTLSPVFNALFFKGAFLVGLAAEDFVVAVGVEGRLNVNQVNAGVRQFGGLFENVAAVDDASIEEGGGFQPSSSNGLVS